MCFIGFTRRNERNSKEGIMTTTNITELHDRVKKLGWIVGTNTDGTYYGGKRFSHMKGCTVANVNYDNIETVSELNYLIASHGA